MNKRQERELSNLYRTHYTRMVIYAQTLLGNYALAEESVQEVFRIACQKPQSICESKAPEGWLLLTLKYVVFNNRRSREAATRIIEAYTAVVQDETKEDLLPIELLYSDLQHMEEFKLLKEFAVEGRTYHEMAESRGISYAACKQRVFRARGILKNKIFAK